MSRYSLEELKQKKASGYLPFFVKVNRPGKMRRWKKTGYWTEKQKLKYGIFIEYFSEAFQIESRRRFCRIFDLMSIYLTTRSAEQCRSHHQKMQINKYNVQNIIERVADLYGPNYYQQFKSRQLINILSLNLQQLQDNYIDLKQKAKDQQQQAKQIQEQKLQHINCNINNCYNKQFHRTLRQRKLTKISLSKSYDRNQQRRIKIQNQPQIYKIQPQSHQIRNVSNDFRNNNLNKNQLQQKLMNQQFCASNNTNQPSKTHQNNPNLLNLLPQSQINTNIPNVRINPNINQNEVINYQGNNVIPSSSFSVHDPSVDIPVGSIESAPNYSAIMARLAIIRQQKQMLLDEAHYYSTKYYQSIEKLQNLEPNEFQQKRI